MKVEKMKFELPESIRKSFDAWAGCVAGALENKSVSNHHKESWVQKRQNRFGKNLQ